MTNPKNPNPNNREDNVTKEIETSYGDAYSDGRVSGRKLKNEAEVRDQNNTAGGLLIGIGIATLLGLSGLAYYLWGRPPSNPIIVTPAPAQQPAKQTTIIEKTNTVERVPVPVVVPLPQQSVPNVNVKVDAPQSQVPKQEKKEIVPNNPQPAPATQNTTINVAPPESSTKIPTSASSPDPNSKTQTSPNQPKTNSDAGNIKDSNP
ncbi:hypothetical protein [Anabaena sp. UHCC 0451]|uniref:hypothetical protein n=1 Tax=Anabaena sp. UHCC 0451 TaxID=2055235 RepID=UPI002B1FA21C|nr:hypothetical protein [Anabaena sp. UHCC 0451]MEA5575687.1 hypothetical protein [Anabaena sp. UHCC 0451]